MYGSITVCYSNMIREIFISFFDNVIIFIYKLLIIFKSPRDDYQIFKKKKNFITVYESETFLYSRNVYVLVFVTQYDLRDYGLFR